MGGSTQVKIRGYRIELTEIESFLLQLPGIAQASGAQYRRVPAANCSTRRRVIFSLLQLFNRLVLVLPAGVLGLAVLLPSYLDTGHLQLGAIEFFVDTGCPGSPTFPCLFGDSSHIVHYLKALGYDLGKVVQTGSDFGPAVAHESPFLSSVGSGTMTSDGLNMMNADFTSTSFRLSRVSIAGRCFLGNDITFPVCARVGENCLLGTKVMVPIDGPLRSDVGLLGSPPFEIPRSVQRDARFDDLKLEEAKDRVLPEKNRHNIVTMALFMALRWFLLLYTATLTGAIAAG